MREITDAIKARRTQIAQLQKEVQALKAAATALRRKRATKVARSKTTRQRTPNPKVKGKRRALSVAAKEAVSERMKKYWAKRKK